MRIPLTPLLSLILVSNCGSAQWSQQDAVTHCVIERLEFVGPRRVESATLRMKVSSRPGQPCNAEQVERDAQGLRDTGFFDEVRAEVTDSPDQPNAKIVAFYLRERPVIRRVEYRGVRSLSTQDLLRAYKEQKIGLSVETYFDQQRMERAAAVIKNLLIAKGHPSATVKPTYEVIAATNTVTIHFNVEEGPKAKSP
jgi:outer membrane protein insertion porin family